MRSQGTYKVISLGVMLSTDDMVLVDKSRAGVAVETHVRVKRVQT